MNRNYEPYRLIMENLLAGDPELANNKSEFARQVLELSNEEVRSVDAMRKLVKAFLDGPTETIEVDTEERVSYEVLEGDYVWKTKFGGIKIPVSQIDKMFYEYSRHGLDYSASEMRQKHNVQPWEWNSIKSRLQLTKDSDIFSPYTVEETDPSELEAMVSEKMRAMAQDFRGRVVKNYNQEIYKEYRKKLMEFHKRELFSDEMLDMILSIKPKVERVQLNTVPSGPSDPNHIVISIADLHSGALVEDLPITRNYSSKVLEEYLDRAANIINGFRAKNVTILSMGDLIESFTGLNHKNSWHSMEAKMYGAKAYWNAYDLMLGFLNKINNLHSVLGIPGNHCRGSENKDVDPIGEIGMLILEGLKRTLEPAGIEVEYNSMVVSKEIDGINYIITHGDKKMSEAKTPYQINNYGKNDLYNLVLSAHLHTLEVPKNGDTQKFRRVRVPPFFSGNFYSESNGWTSQPGFIVFQNNGFGVSHMLNYNF